MNLVRLSGLHVARGGRPVLSGVDLHLAKAERLALLGRNGAGKTTLLRSIIGLETAGSGQVALFGAPCRTEADFRRHRPRIGFLFQDSDDQLFCPSVIEDVAFGPLNLGHAPPKALAMAEAVLQDLGIAHLAPRFTHRLSGGEKRLVALAGLLAMQPDLLLLDEPTAAMDAESAALLIAALRGFSGAMILVSHDAGLVAGLATRALRLDRGCVTEAPVPMACSA